MTPLIHGDSALLDEIEIELKALSLEPRRLRLHALSAEAAEGAYQVIGVAVGASLTLLAQALVAYMQKRQGQRKVSVQFPDKSGSMRCIEVETPRLDEVEVLLAQARGVIIERKEDKPEQSAAPLPSTPALPSEDGR